MPENFAARGLWSSGLNQRWPWSRREWRGEDWQVDRFRVQQTWRILNCFRGTSEDIWKEAAAQEMGRERQRKWDGNWPGGRGGRRLTCCHTVHN